MLQLDEKRKARHYDQYVRDFLLISDILKETFFLEEQSYSVRYMTRLQQRNLENIWFWEPYIRGTKTYDEAEPHLRKQLELYLAN